jgi:hypothetical protein
MIFDASNNICSGENKTSRERKIGAHVCSIIALNSRIIRLHVQIATALLVKCSQQLAIIVFLARGTRDLEHADSARGASPKFIPLR